MREENSDPEVPKFRYNREERMAGLPEHIGQRGRKGVFKGNRSLVITLIDVVFLVMLVVVFSVVSRLNGDNRILPGYSVTARATQFDERALVSIKVRSREDRADAEPIRIRISYPDGGERIEISGYLPSVEGGEDIFRGALEDSGGHRQVRIDFFSGSKNGSMTAKLRRE